MSPLELILSCFPSSLRFGFLQYIDNDDLEQIHLCRGGQIFIKRFSAGISVLDLICTDADFDHILKMVCAGSVYAHDDTIKNGYISFAEGIRIGVCGQGVSNGEEGLVCVRRIESMSIRIPHYPVGVASALVDVLAHYGYKRGILVYSPPGVGKTTLLRDLARTLTRAPHYLRLCLIDPRGELDFPDSRQSPTLDIYKAYPTGAAISSAVRTMSPEMIICDEIGGVAERDAILYSLGKGVPIVASAHGDRIDHIIANKSIGALHEAGAFACYVGITRSSALGTRFTYTEASEL